MLNEIRRSIGYLRKARVHFPSLLLSVLASVGVAFLNLYVLRLLFPLTRGIITSDFSAVRQLALLGGLSQALPQCSPFLLLLCWVYLMSVLRSVLSVVSYWLLARESKRASLELRQLTLERYLRFGKPYFDRANSSRLVSQVLRCSDWIGRLLTDLHRLLSDGLKLLVYATVMVAVSPWLTLSVVAVLPLFGLGLTRIRARLKSLSDMDAQAQTESQTALHETLSLLTLIRTSSRTQSVREHFLRLARREGEASDRIARLKSLHGPVREVSITTAQLAMAVTVAWLIPGGHLEPARILVFFYLALLVVPVYSSLLQFRLRQAERSGSIEIFEGLLEDGDKFIVPSGNRPFPVDFGQIEVRQLTFAYPGHPPVLHNLSFHLRRGATLGIVGASGAGKSTLLQVLLRLYDCPANTILVDGLDVREFCLDSVRASMALVEQEVPVLQATLRENLIYAAERPPTENELLEVLEATQLRHWKDRLEERIGQGGVRLSGGEKQRLALARALLKNAEILLLDEPTSALDVETEKLILQGIGERLRHSTTILVAHRLSLLSQLDQILVLSEGRLVQSGSYDQLASQPGPFQSMLAAAGLWPGQISEL